MGNCINHPERETNYICMKHNIFLCEECLECRDPYIYCKFRPSCPIYFITKKGFDSSENENEKIEPDHPRLTRFLPHTDANLFPNVHTTKTRKESVSC